MSFIFSKREDSARYKVRVVGTDTQKVNSLTAPVSKGKRVISNVVNKAISTLMVALFSVLAFLGAIVAATPAQADFISDGFKNAFCSQGLFNYNLSTKFLGPNTGDHKVTQQNITPYEKYGSAGLNYTVWLGPERAQGLDKEGEFGGVSIVNFAGGKDASEIDDWGNGIADAGDNQSTKVLSGFYNKDQTCVPFVDIISTDVANTLLNTTGEVINITNLVYQTAYEASSNIIVWLEPVVKSVVGTLKDAVFFAFLTPVIMISALWMAWVGLVKRQSTQMAQGAMWMIGASVASVALMTNPMWLPNTINTGVTSISQAGMNAVSSATTKNSGDDMCVGGSSGAAPTAIDTSGGERFLAPDNSPAGAATRQNVRQMQCTMWYSFMYTPWVMGEFGTNPSTATDDSHIKEGWREALDGRRLGGANKDVVQLGANAGAYNAEGYRTSGKVAKVKLGAYEPTDKSQNWALFMLDNQINYPDSTEAQRQQQQLALLNVTASQLHKDNYNGAFKGEGAESRMATAGLSLIAALGAGLMVVIVAMSIIILDVGMIILVLVSPLFFLIGVHPGMGRRVALGWAETILGLAIKRVVLSMVLAVMLIFYGSILAQGSELPWMISMILVVAVSIGGITYKDKIIDMFGKVSLGGNGGLGSPDMPGSRHAKRFLKKQGKKALGMSTGEFDAKEFAQEISKTNRGAGSRPNESSSSAPSARDRAAAAVLEEQNSGAGEAPRGEVGPDSSTPDASGAGAAPNELPAEETAENAPEGDTSGAGDRPQHYTDANGNIVDIDGNVVETSELSEEEKAALGGAGERPTVAVPLTPAQQARENLKSSNPSVIAERQKAEADREENKRRLLPPLPVTPAMQNEASKYNKAVDKEQAKLSRNSDAPVTRTEAMESLQQKEASAAESRRIREERKQFIEQKRKEILVEPARELKEMASSADASFGNPVKKTVAKASSTAQRAGAKMETSLEQRRARADFESQVTERMKQDARQMKEQAKQIRERQKSIPKEFRQLDSRV